jgi:hypothetical protein
LENVKGNDYLRDLGPNRKIILKFFLKEQGVRVWTGFNWLRTGIIGEFFNTVIY